MIFPRRFDCIVVGGGHAGIEAALASGRMGARTLLISHDLDTIGQMSCNPAIGGIGKGHIVREIDALGGAMGQLIDAAGIQWRILNSRKGPAVRATRAQADKALYKNLAKNYVEQADNVELFQQGVDDLILKNGHVAGVITQSGLKIEARAVVLTTGTFLGGVMHVGLEQSAGGRAGNAPSISLAKRLRELVNNVGRLKTGTPPRLDGRSIDFKRLEEQPGESPVPQFSYLPRLTDAPRQIACHIAHTNEKTHDIIRDSLDRSPLYSGVIDSTGPRYCPSIEDKVVRFGEKTSHQIFVEPEGLNTVEVYPNGISTSLPFDVQWNLVRSIAGFENAIIMRAGYAIEYDYLDPRDLRPTLESKLLPGLYLAGQINGTTGYEEAGGQGLIAGLNAAAAALDKDSWYPTRDTSYIGVMIDDLITRGASEPYRMFTSRAEYRLLLREDNADARLTELGHTIGVVNQARFSAWQQKRDAIEREEQRLGNIWFVPQKPSGEVASELIGQPLRKEVTALDLLRRPEINMDAVQKLEGVGVVESPLVGEQVEIRVKYQGYIERQQIEISRLKKNENTLIPADFDYQTVSGLSNEVKQKLERHRPHSIGQAGRIDGITPAAISLLLVHLKKKGQLGGEAA